MKQTLIYVGANDDNKQTATTEHIERERKTRPGGLEMCVCVEDVA